MGARKHGEVAALPQPPLVTRKKASRELCAQHRAVVLRPHFRVLLLYANVLVSPCRVRVAAYAVHTAWRMLSLCLSSSSLLCLLFPFFRWRFWAAAVTVPVAVVLHERVRLSEWVM